MSNRDRQAIHPPLPPVSRGSASGLDDRATFSTRGQRLPQIIRENSRKMSAQLPRRTPSGADAWRDEEGDVESDGRQNWVSKSVEFQRSAEHKPERKQRAPRMSVSGDGRGIDLEGLGMMDGESDDGAQSSGRETILPPEPLMPPSDFPLTRWASMQDDKARELAERRASVLVTPQMRSQRLIGNANPRYRWEQYYKSEAELKKMRKDIRRYYERNNYLIMQYLYIDRLLDSSLPHNLIQEYGQNQLQAAVKAQPGLLDVPPTIGEEFSPTRDSADQPSSSSGSMKADLGGVMSPTQSHPIKRTKSIYKVDPNERTPLLDDGSSQKLPDDAINENAMPAFQVEDEDSSERVVTVAIYINLIANTLLLILKIIVMVLTSSLSVLASLVDAALDFLSTAIVWTTTRLISSSGSEKHKYPVGKQRLEPLGVVVFAVIMITSFFQVALEAINRLMGPDHTVVKLSPAAIAIMSSTVVVKAACWFWCRLVKNSSVQALAQDAVTDVIFNTFSIIFPLLGYFLTIWWLDPLGGLLLSLYVMISWGVTTYTHILNLVGQTASADERNILLYLTMRFAKCIRKIQNIAVYHVGDKLNVEVDIVLNEDVIGGEQGDDTGLSSGARALRDIHDLGESLQYVLESVPGVERAFVHSDYWEGNLPSHMVQ